MPTDRMISLIQESLHRDPTAEKPLRPVKEYEEVVTREVTVATFGGPQDMTLFPEDELTVNIEGVRIDFKTIGTGQGWFFAPWAHIGFVSYQESTAKREKGSLRPDPKKIQEEFMKRQEQDRADRVAQRIREAQVQQERTGEEG